MNFAAFSLREEIADKQNFEYVPRENVFLKDARMHQRRREASASSRKNACKNMLKINDLIIVIKKF